MWKRPNLRTAPAAALLLLCMTATLALNAMATPALDASAAPAHDATATPSLAAVAAAAHELTKADADAWLDGFMPYALERNDIAGAEVAIVKDGQVLTLRGFGYSDVAAHKPVDPAVDMFRPGSVSKLFTWTAVMQLVEEGKIDLDVDVNRYLDFSIPAYDGKPITMRNLLTHSAGFEEAVKGGFRFEGDVPPLGDVLKHWIPKRVFPPGTTPAYSNWGAALAGYIVERISREPYDTYIEHYILQPLGMSHTTFQQPLPASLAPFMAKGYVLGSGPAQPYELISVPPAGSAAASAADMAKFMIAHLNQGAGLLQPQTARQMQDPTYVSVPGTNRMALGFYEQRINDLSAIGHGGDLNFFHTYLWLIPSRQVGLYVSFNSAGTENFGLRLAFFQQFGDRYFPPANAAPPVEQPTAREHAKLLAGSYLSSRGSFSNFLDVLNLLEQANIGLDDDGRPLLPAAALPGMGDTARHWIEIAPFVWQDAYGQQRLAAKVANGRVVRWSVDEISPFMVFDRVPWYRDAAWLLPASEASLVAVLIGALSWPAGALIRRRYGVALAATTTALAAVTTAATSHRLTYHLLRGSCVLVFAVLGGWAFLFTLISDPGSNVRGLALDAIIVSLELLGIVAFCGLFACAMRNLWIVRARRAGWFPVVCSVLTLLASVFLLWAAAGFHLLSIGTNF
jgi:CubicO group peptidase (beta-lactamase class C family)